MTFFSMKKMIRSFYIYNNFTNRRLQNYFTKMEIILLYNLIEIFSTYKNLRLNK